MQCYIEASHPSISAVFAPSSLPSYAVLQVIINSNHYFSSSALDAVSLYTVHYCVRVCVCMCVRHLSIQMKTNTIYLPLCVAMMIPT